jgi:asparagine synthase (glutamine-hydrolysing)
VCGIAGYTHFDRRPDPEVILKSTIVLRHRGPDDLGTFESPDISLGSVRLKIIDLEGGDQPMQTEEGNCIIAFNGEIYNYKELRLELEGLGHAFRSRCDTEVALRAFDEWDVDCFSKFRGMFAAAIWDARRRRLVLVRDRLGIKPLYYSVRQGNVFFGSELKSLFGHHQLPRRLCRDALGFFLSLNYVPGPLTLLDGIYKLQPGTWLDCRKGRITTGRYWTNTCAPRPASLSDASSELDSLLHESMREHLTADVPVGIWASGGLDSSTVLHYAAHHSSRPLRTFSLSFEGRTFDESAYFRPLAQHYGTIHEELDLHTGLDLASTVHDIAYYSDEPCADAGALPVWFLSKLTAKHVTVALSGEGADEVFGGYQTYQADRYASMARRLPLAFLRGCGRVAESLPVSDEKIGFEYKLKRFLAGAQMSAEEAHFFWNGTFSRQQQRDLFASDPEPAGNLFRRLPGDPGGGFNLNKCLFVDQCYYLPDDILHKCDRMSMAHSIELRPPFLDHRIVDFAARLPLEFKIKGRQTKYVLRKLMNGKLPRTFTSRRKEGLDIPAHEWLRGALRPLLCDTLSFSSVAGAGLFDPFVVQKLVDDHLSRRTNLGYHLWGLLTLHLWIQRWKIETEEISHVVLRPDFDSVAG